MVQQGTVDVIGVVLDVQPVSEISLRDGTKKDRRTVTVGDESNIMIGVTLWGEACHKADFEVGQIIAFRQCRISEYRGKSLNASSAISDTVIQPDHPRTAQLMKWVSQSGHVGELKNDMRSLGGDLNPTTKR